MDTPHAARDPLASYRAVESRDARFDGRLFVGVTSTGIYCRPICRVRPPMFKNCRFFDTPAQAEAAAFRPCLKCRPEIAPGAPLAWTVMDASRTLARQAAEALDARTGDDEPGHLTALAARLGVSDRHLRRIFLAEHGVSPLQYVQTRRLLLAKQLLTDTCLPMSQVAWASGFRSLRRFNAAFVGSYRMSPSRLRGQTDAPATANDAAVTVRLAYRPPFDVEALLRFLDRRAIAGLEGVAGRRVRRSLRAGILAPAPGWIEAEFLPDRALVILRFTPAWWSASAAVVRAARRWLDLDADPHTIHSALADLPGAPGGRLPGTLDNFELAVRAVLGQQVTVAAARTLAGRLVDRFGTALATPWAEVGRTFPAPAALAAAASDEIGALGIIGRRGAAIQALARDWPRIDAMLAGRAPPEAVVQHLTTLPGIGAWTAHYIAMRALGWPDAFPPDDVAVRKAMGQLFGHCTPREARLRAQAWQPWRAYAVLRLWNTLGTHP